MCIRDSPPVVVPTNDLVEVAYGDVVIASTTAAQRILETSQPPAFYIPRKDIDLTLLVPGLGQSFCEWKGRASYFDLVVGENRIHQVGWTYDAPTPPFAAITSHLAFYAQKLDCSVDGEAVVPNEGSFYGGWVTSAVVGPFKGAPGTNWW